MKIEVNDEHIDEVVVNYLRYILEECLDANVPHRGTRVTELQLRDLSNGLGTARSLVDVINYMSVKRTTLEQAIESLLARRRRGKK